MFLQEECYLYINESGVIEQNVKTLLDIKNHLHQPQANNNSWFSWIQSPLMSLLASLLPSIILLFLELNLAPCFIPFFQKYIHTQMQKHF